MSFTGALGTVLSSPENIVLAFQAVFTGTIAHHLGGLTQAAIGSLSKYFGTASQRVGHLRQNSTATYTSLAAMVGDGRRPRRSSSGTHVGRRR